MNTAAPSRLTFSTSTRPDAAAPTAATPPKRGRGRPRNDGKPNKSTARLLGLDAGAGAGAGADDLGDDDAAYEDVYAEQDRGYEPVKFPSPLSILKTGAKKLDEMEARAIRPFLIEAITGYSDYADDLISRTNRNRVVLTGDNAIWSSLTALEIATLADGILVIGKRVPHVAVAVREVAKTWHMVQAGIILVPRFLATMRFYADNGGIALW